jgi:hypothetical protein
VLTNKPPVAIPEESLLLLNYAAIPEMHRNHYLGTLAPNLFPDYLN